MNFDTIEYGFNQCITIGDIKYVPKILPNVVIVNIYRNDFFPACKNHEELTSCFSIIYNKILSLDCEFYIFTVSICETSNALWISPVLNEIKSLLYKLGSKVKNYVCLVNNTIDDSWYPQGINVIKIPYNLLSTVAWYSNTKHFYNWKPENKKILFLPGKLDKPNRLPVLYHLLESHFKDQLIYSCNINYQINKKEEGLILIEKLVEVLNLYTNRKWDLDSTRLYIELIKKDIDLDKDSKHFFVTPTELYKEIKLEIVAETWIYHIEHLSEKSFKPIVLGYPFIHVNRKFKDSLNFFKFKTYDDFLPEYRKTNDANEYINQFLIDLPIFVDEINKNVDKIQDIINYNKTQSIALYNHFTSVISAFIPGFENYHSFFYTQYLEYNKKTKKILPVS